MNSQHYPDENREAMPSESDLLEELVSEARDTMNRTGCRPEEAALEVCDQYAADDDDYHLVVNRLEAGQ